MRQLDRNHRWFERLPRGRRNYQYTEAARRVLALMNDEADDLNHGYIGTEHLLLALLREGDNEHNIAHRVLIELGIDYEEVRDRIVQQVGRGDWDGNGERGLTPRANRALELAMKEARKARHQPITTEHLLLGLVEEGEGIAVKVLCQFGIDPSNIRRAMAAALNIVSIRANGDAGRASNRSNVITCRLNDKTLEAIDALVEAGVRSTRSDAAAWLIETGVQQNQELLDRVSATVAQIRQLRAEARNIANGVVQGEASTENDTTAAGDA